MQKIHSSNPTVVTGICDPNKSQAQHHHSLKLGLKLKDLNIIDNNCNFLASEMEFFMAMVNNINLVTIAIDRSKICYLGVEIHCLWLLLLIVILITYRREYMLYIIYKIITNMGIMVTIISLFKVFFF